MVGQYIERMFMTMQPSKEFFKKGCYEKFRRIYMKTSEAESLFLVFSCEFCKIFRSILFTDYSSINSTEGSIGGVQALSSEIYKISQNTFFYRRVPVKGFGTKAGVTIKNKYQNQLRKSICCRENPEAATVDVL